MIGQSYKKQDGAIGLKYIGNITLGRARKQTLSLNYDRILVYIRLEACNITELEFDEVICS